MAKNLNNDLFLEAKNYLVGGVNSPVRAFKAVGGYPIFIKSARGVKIYSEDGRQFIDYCQSFGALILGHSHPKVLKKIKERVFKGTSFSAPTRLETDLAKIIIEAMPSIEKLRLTNSGTEAVMSAIRLARAYTKKKKIIKFEGSYHGHADYLLSCPGVPGDFRKHTLTSPYNDIKKVKELFRRNNKDIAAVIVEPVAANMGVVLPENGFLERLRELTLKNNSVLIFDEVITGFRVSFGGAQERFLINPDLTCLGKIIGGGLPAGAFGGRKEIMKLLAPEGKVYQAGTFSGNSITATAGHQTLKILSQENPYLKLEKVTKYLCDSISDIANNFGIKIRINYIGSMFSVFFTDKEVTDYSRASTQNTVLFKKFYQGLLKEGVYFSPSGFETNFLTCAHTKLDINKTLIAIKKVFNNLGE